MVERRPDRVRACARSAVDRRRPPRRDGRQLPGLGARRCASASTCRTWIRDEIQDAIVSGVVERYRTRAAARDPGRHRGRPADRRNGCPSRSPRPRTPTSSRRPSTRWGCETSSARSCPRTRCRTASRRRTCTSWRPRSWASTPVGAWSWRTPLNGVKAGKAAGMYVVLDPERERPAAGRHRGARRRRRRHAGRPRPGPTGRLIVRAARSPGPRAPAPASDSLAPSP